MLFSAYKLESHRFCSVENHEAPASEPPDSLTSLREGGHSFVRVEIQAHLVEAARGYIASDVVDIAVVIAAEDSSLAAYKPADGAVAHTRLGMEYSESLDFDVYRRQHLRCSDQRKKIG